MSFIRRNVDSLVAEVDMAVEEQEDTAEEPEEEQVDTV
jgi:hypothetical protein